jgi:hypothetical protein
MTERPQCEEEKPRGQPPLAETLAVGGRAGESVVQQPGLDTSSSVVTPSSSELDPDGRGGYTPTSASTLPLSTALASVWWSFSFWSA